MAAEKTDTKFVGGTQVVSVSLRDVEPVKGFLRTVANIAAKVNPQSMDPAHDLVEIKAALTKACRDVLSGIGDASRLVPSPVTPSRSRWKPEILSIVMLGHDRWDCTKRCIESLIKCTDTRFQLVFVDNGSSDDTVCMASIFPYVTYVRSEINLGVAKGRNLGLSYAAGEVICFLDNDLVVTPGWDSKLLEHLADPRVGMVGTHGSLITSGNEFTTPPWTGDAIPVDYLRGQCQMFRRTLLQVIGYQDENLVWHEDSEFSHRVQLAGLQLRAVRIDMLHEDGATTKQTRPGKEFQRRFESDLHYLRKKSDLSNIVRIARTPCIHGTECSHSLCMLTRNLQRHLRDFGYTVLRQPTRQFAYPPLLLSLAFMLEYKGLTFGTFHVENDRVSEEYAKSMDCDINLCTSTHIMGALQRSGVSPSRLLHCNINSANTHVFKPVTDPPVALSPGTPFTFLWVGASQIRKGTDILIAAFGMAFKPGDPVRLVIKDGGYGWREWTESLIADSPMRDQIQHIWGDVSQEDLATLYQSASFGRGCFVHPHRAEGFGRPILEAMLCGCRSGLTGWGGPMDFAQYAAGMLFPHVLERSTFHNHAGEPYFSKDEIQPQWAVPDVNAVAEWMKRMPEEKCNRDALLETSKALALRYSDDAVGYRFVSALSALCPDSSPGQFGAGYWQGGEGSAYAAYSENECHVAQAALLTDLFCLKGKRVLDVGGGYGFLAKHLRLLGVDAYGLDPSSFAIDQSPVKEFMREGKIEDSTVAERLNREVGGFDFIFSLDALEHVQPERIRRAFLNVRSLLKVGGVACLIPGTTENHTMHLDRTHQIFRNGAWWDHEFFGIFDASPQPPEVTWKETFHNRYQFAKDWYWHPLVGIRTNDPGEA